MTMRGLTRAELAWALAAVTAVIVLAPSSTATAAPPALSVTAVFDKASYASGDTISVRFSVHNAGASAAVGITAQQNFDPTELALDEHGFGVFANGATIPARGTVTVTLTGHQPGLTAADVTLDGNLFDRSGVGIGVFSASAPIAQRTGTVSGLVFGDANANGRPDPGEALPAVTLRFLYAYGDDQFTAVTGSNGRFRSTLPTADYQLDGSGGGWAVIPRKVTVGPGNTDLSLRAVKPLGNVLRAAIRFTKSTYTPGETVHLVVTLTNIGSQPLFGIGTACDRDGGPDDLNNAGAGWGALIASGPGVTFAAHQTHVFAVTDTVPAGAQRAGFVFVACDFGYPDVGARADAHARAAVPGQFGAVAANVLYYPHGRGTAGVGLAGVRVILIDPGRCPVFARSATTDAHGHLRIGGAPAGPGYELYLFPPTGWKVVGVNPSPVFVHGNDTSTLYVEVQRGSASALTVPRTQCVTPTSPPGSGAIANTGADTGATAVAGGGAVLAGVVLLLAGRRRRTH